VNDLVDQGVMALTGTSSVSSAWKQLLPNYQRGQGIAVKVSFNNWGESERIDAVIHPVNAIVRGLKQIGVAESDVWVYDSTRGMPNSFVSGCLYSGVRFFSTYHEQPGWSSSNPTAQVTFHPPAGLSMPAPIRVTDLLVNTRYVINLPIMKKHKGAGLSLGFKNHFGSIDHPYDLHNYIGVMIWVDNYDALVDLYRNPNVGPKTVLVVGDGLYGSRSHGDPPENWKTFGNHPPNSMFFATDPVAIDSVMCDFLAAEFGVESRADNYLKLASQAGLGIFERGNPWGNGYSKIDYLKIER
jgi:hypothetical protein